MILYGHELGSSLPSRAHYADIRTAPRPLGRGAVRVIGAGMSERKLTSNILTALRQRWPEAWWIKVHGGPMQQAGVPDIIGCVDGQFVGLEVKLPDGKHGVTDLQAHTMKQIRLARGIAVVVTSVAEAEDLVTTLTE